MPIILCFVVAVLAPAFAQTAPQDDKTSPPAKKSSDQPTEVIDLKNANPDKIPKPSTKAAPPTEDDSGPLKDGGGIEILSDTKGVDFGPYLKRLHVIVQARWDGLIPEVAKAPTKKSGTVVIEFVILKDGTVTSMRLVHSSGDVSMDRAAWNSFSFGPLPQLPGQFTGDYVLIRAYFLYNPPPKPAPDNPKDKN